MNDGGLASLSNVNLTIGGSSTIATAQLQSFAGAADDQRGSPSFSGLTSFNGGNITVSGGATLSLPGVTSYTGNGNTTTLEATGTGSTLTLANLATVTQTANNYPAQPQVRGAGRRHGDVVGVCKTINTGTVVLESDGAGSVLNVSALTGFTEANGWTYSTLQASNGGTVNDSSLASLSNVNVTIAGAGENLTLGSLTSFTQRQHHGQRRGDAQPAGPHQLHRQRRHDHAGGDRHGQRADPGQPDDRDRGAPTTTRPQTQFEALAGGTVTLAGAEDDQHRHGGPGKRRHRQRA